MEVSLGDNASRAGRKALSDKDSVAHALLNVRLSVRNFPGKLSVSHTPLSGLLPGKYERRRVIRKTVGPVVSCQCD